VASYLIFDRKRRRDVEIARIVHGAQDIRRP
jgi:plasmid stabilization system protein ParE